MTKEEIAAKHGLVHTEPLDSTRTRTDRPPAPHQLGKTKDGKWYGWSHRAISSFKTKQQAKRFARSVS